MIIDIKKNYLSNSDCYCDSKKAKDSKLFELNIYKYFFTIKGLESNLLQIDKAISGKAASSCFLPSNNTYLIGLNKNGSFFEDSYFSLQNNKLLSMFKSDDLYKVIVKKLPKNYTNKNLIYNSIKIDQTELSKLQDYLYIIEGTNNHNYESSSSDWMLNFFKGFFKNKIITYKPCDSVYSRIGRVDKIIPYKKFKCKISKLKI